MKKESKMLFEPCVRRLANEGLTRSAVVIGLIIASFCKGREGIYYGSREYLATLASVSVRTVQRAIGELVKLGLVERVERSGHVCLLATEALMGEKKTSARAKNSPEKGESAPETTENKTEAAPNTADGGTRPTETAKKSPEKGICSPLYPREPYKYAYESEGMPVRYQMLELGRYGYVQMTPKQYEALLTLAPPELVRSYIIRFEQMLSDNMHRGGEVKAPHSHYHTVKKWMHVDLSV